MADLLGQIRAHVDGRRGEDIDLANALAVHAVFDLHQPQDFPSAFNQDWQSACRECGKDWDGSTEGCPTIQAIASALGIQEGGNQP